MGWRAIILVTQGEVSPQTWVEAALEEPPVDGRPLLCAECPMREGQPIGQALAARKEAFSPAQRALVRSRWGCHKADRPCAGVVAILKK